MAGSQVIFQFLSAGARQLTVPPGYSNQVLAYVWAAGGGSGTNSGGGGGYVAGIVTINANDDVIISVGSPGRDNSDANGGQGGQGFNSVIPLNGGRGGSGGSRNTVSSNVVYDWSVNGILQGTYNSPPPVNTAPQSIIRNTISTVYDWYGKGGIPLGTRNFSAPTTAASSKTGGSKNTIIGAGGTYSVPRTVINTTTVPAPTAGSVTYVARVASSTSTSTVAAGGGGGAASAIIVNGNVAVAAGGGGGGGVTSAGFPGGSSGLVNSTSQGANGDSGGTGGGGSGYPYGGRQLGGAGGGGGQNYYDNVLVSDQILQSGSGVSPGGTSTSFYPRRNIGSAGYAGAIILVFTKNFNAWIKNDDEWKQANNAWIKMPQSTVRYTRTVYSSTGVISAVNDTAVTSPAGWKSIVRAWTKVNGGWKAIETPAALNATRSSALPQSYVTVNLTIAADVNNYNLIDFLAATNYYPGRTIINLTIDAGVVVGSDSAGTPALSINGLTNGDRVTLINYGRIQGKGGDGGPTGSYTATTTSSGGGAIVEFCFPAGTMISTPTGPVAIETIQSGDLVNAYDIGVDLNSSAELVAKPVTQTHKHDWIDGISPLVVIKHTLGELIVTAEHEILCLNKYDADSDYPGFVRAENLTKGDTIYSEDGTALVVTSVESGPVYDTVYNFEVADFHTYVADGIRVHNGLTQPSTGKFNTRVSTTTIKSVPGLPGEPGGVALYVAHPITLENGGIIAGGGGGGGGGGGPTGGAGGGGAAYGAGANNGTLTAGGAGSGFGGAGGAPGANGGNGTNDKSNGGRGGSAGFAIEGSENVTVSVSGTIAGPLKLKI